MKLQSLLFPQTGICTEEEMYFRREGEGEIDFTWEKKATDMHRNSTLTFDTYFNGCSAEKWFKYTKVKRISISLRVRGFFRIILMRKEKNLDSITTKYLLEQSFGREDEEGVYTFPFESESNNGVFCFQVTCLSETGTLLDGWYEGEVAPEDVRPVKLALDICTFKREVFVIKNVKELYECFLNNPESGMKDSIEIFISDNAKTLDPKEVLLCDKVHVFPNKNTGGAGGFTRGMIEIMKCREQRKITHVLVMDDDIIINPDSIYRTFVILSLLKDEYKDAFVGGAMLRLDTQNIQTENGARWNKGYLISHKSGLDLSEVEACLYNEFEEKTEYNAWWYCAFPADIVTEKNLPLPIFIRGDDVEYGLRNLKNLILMNGICVWHEPFENKYSSSMYYYIFRNRLIDNSVHDLKYKRKMFINDLAKQVKRELVFYRYKNAELLLDGAEDFFKGIDWLMAQDGEELHKSVISRGYKLQDINDISMPFSYPEYERACKTPEPNWITRKWRKLTANGLVLPCQKRPENEMPVIAPTFTARPVNFYRAHRVLHYDFSSRRAFVTEKSSNDTLRLMMRLWKLDMKSRTKYRKTVRAFFNRGHELMELEFWKNYLDLK